ncbi:hypothetical protein [Burkholderia ambifaria]|uniref:hypothetical protein n=1 Tax=Burkholderia ambifaria TaxID=152480 RepID=UPI0018E076C0|nr:hypothetical protein [Burkholderia ambifaria]
MFEELILGQSKPYSMFTIKMDEDGMGNVRGRYCFITQNGNRIDCSPDEEFNIKGRISGDKNKAIVNFYSFFGASDGVAEMTVNSNRLQWRVIERPKGGDYYGPFRVELLKEDLPRHRARERKVGAGRAILSDIPSRLHKSHLRGQG